MPADGGGLEQEAPTLAAEPTTAQQKPEVERASVRARDAELRVREAQFALERERGERLEKRLKLTEN
eukprot:scaffold233_cov243-Pinguiococcus_pyrenoidosus.AAC.6